MRDGLSFEFLVRFRGTPFFHSMIARIRAYETDIAVLVDREAILFPDFISTLSYAYKLEMDWFLFALPRNVTNFSYQPDENGHHWLDEDVKDFKMQQVRKLIPNENFNFIWNLFID